MAIEDADRFPPEPTITGALSLVRNGLMQSDMDAQGYRILNLDTSNLVLDELPSQAAQPNKWFNSYNQGTHSFGVLQPAFVNLLGNLSRAQQLAITRIGTIVEGVWNATQINATYLPTLNLIRSPTGDVNLRSHKIVNLSDPVQDQDAVTLHVLNGRNSGTQPKAAVRCATTGSIVLSGLGHTIDGVTLASNDRVLVKNSSPSRLWENGIWNAQSGAWTRTADCDTDDELEFCTCFVLEGDTQTGMTFLETNAKPLGLHPNEPAPYPEFALYSVSNVITAGNGLGQTGSTIFAVGTANRISVGATIDIDIGYVGQGSLTHVGTIDTGTWEGALIDGEFGGTGVNNGGKTITVTGNFVTAPFGDLPGGQNLTLQMTSSTTLTLPSLGRVATTDQDEVFTNKHISADQVDSGVLLITNGGTSADTAMAALRNLLPDATGHTGETLHTDGGSSGPGPATPPTFYWA